MNVCLCMCVCLFGLGAGLSHTEGDGGPAGFGDPAVVPAGGSGGGGFVAEVGAPPPGAPLADLVQQAPCDTGPRSFSDVLQCRSIL